MSKLLVATALGTGSAAPALDKTQDMQLANVLSSAADKRSPAHAFSSGSTSASQRPSAESAAAATIAGSSGTSYASNQHHLAASAASKPTVALECPGKESASGSWERRSSRCVLLIREPRTPLPPQPRRLTCVYSATRSRAGPKTTGAIVVGDRPVGGAFAAEGSSAPQAYNSLLDCAYNCHFLAHECSSFEFCPVEHPSCKDVTLMTTSQGRHYRVQHHTIAVPDGDDSPAGACYLNTATECGEDELVDEDRSGWITCVKLDQPAVAASSDDED